MKHIAQFYHYNSDEYNLELNSPEYFALNFNYDNLNEGYVNWLNLHSTNDIENIRKLCDNFNIDKTTIEDIFIDIKPRLEEYSEYLFFSLKSGLSDDSYNNLKKDKITFILGTNFLISFQNNSSDHFKDVRERITNNKGRLRHKSNDYLLYRMLGCIIDNYTEVIYDIYKDINIIESNINNTQYKFDFSKIENQKRKLLELKKLVSPFKNVLIHLQEMDNYLISSDNRRYFHELYDNVINILDEIDDSKQILDGLSNLYYSVQGQKMNEIMKLLTIISTIFIPLTFIAGLYGMNFEYLPELKWKYGYFIIWSIMILIAISLITYFKKKKWL